MMFSQPRRQFALNPLAVGNTESHRLRRPPNGNAVVADDLAELSGLEECSWVVAAKKVFAPNAAFHPEQSQRLEGVAEVLGAAGGCGTTSTVAWSGPPTGRTVIRSLPDGPPARQRARSPASDTGSSLP